MVAGINGLGLADPRRLGIAAIAPKEYALAVRAPATEPLSKFGKLGNLKTMTVI